MLMQWQHKGARPASAFVVLPPPKAEIISSLQITLHNSQGAEMPVACGVTAGQLKVDPMAGLGDSQSKNL